MHPTFRIGFVSFLATIGCAVTAWAQGSTIVFSATGDIPYGSSEVTTLKQQIQDHNKYSPSEFLVHVGDIKNGTDTCTESACSSVAGYLKALAVPCYIVLGDNEWNNCSNPDQAFTWWARYFTDFENNFCGAPPTEHQSVRHENWAFVSKGVLFVGIDLPAPPPVYPNTSTWNARLQQNADWVRYQFTNKLSQVRAAVIFSQDGPGDSDQSPFFTPFRAAAATFGKPVLFLHGDGHTWIMDHPWPEPNILRVQVNNGGDEDPVQVTVNMDPTKPFVLLRDPWSSNPPVYNRPPCGAAGPLVSIGDATVVEGNTGSTVNAVFTVTLANGSGGTVSVPWSTAPGTAAANVDYVTNSGTVSLSGTSDSKSVSVVVNGDAQAEPDESFYVNLGSPSGGATLGKSQGLGTIRNDDAPPPPAATLTLNPSQDTYAKLASPTSNYGKDTDLRARQDSGKDYRAFLKFDVAGIATSVLSAKLRLYCIDASADGGDVYLVTNTYAGATTPWVETGLTWNKAPQLAGSPIGSLGAVTVGAWKELDVTAILGGNGTYSFGILTHSTDKAYYSSKEGSNKPQLVVVQSSTGPALVLDRDAESAPGAAGLPRRLAITRQIPNPSRGTATIEYVVPRAGSVSLSVYDVAGHAIRRLVEAERSAGDHAVTWDGRDAQGRQVGTGVYFLRLWAGREMVQKRLVLIR